jgi:hypothetical protein
LSFIIEVPRAAGAGRSALHMISATKPARPVFSYEESLASILKVISQNARGQINVSS